MQFRSHYALIVLTFFKSYSLLWLQKLLRLCLGPNFPFFWTLIFFRESSYSRHGYHLNATPILLSQTSKEVMKREYKQNCICPKFFKERFCPLLVCITTDGVLGKPFSEHVSKNVGQFSFGLRFGFCHQFVKDFVKTFVLIEVSQFLNCSFLLRSFSLYSSSQ